MKRKIISVLTLFFLTFMSIGCSATRKNKVWKPIKPKKTFFVHVVQWPNETLPIIAKWYTGDSNNWQSLADANPIINPEQLSAGNKIFIPEDLLKVQKSMPKGFLAKYHKIKKKKKKHSKPVKVLRKQKPAPSQPESLPEEEGEFEIIGPK